MMALSDLSQGCSNKSDFTEGSGIQGTQVKMHKL
jgi:hypothetical protein